MNTESLPTQALPLSRPRRVWLMAGASLIIGVVITAQYVLLDPQQGRVDVGTGAGWVLLETHIFTAFVALVLGPLQFVPAIRAHRRVHRTIGKIYLPAVFISALALIPVALLSGQLVAQIGLTIPGVLWIGTAVLAYRAARARNFVAHRQWMMRNYALTFLAVTARVLVGLMVIGTVVLGGDPAAAAQRLIPVGQVGGWIVNLIIVEIMIRRSARQA